MALPKQSDPQFKLRIPHELKVRIEASASAANRSINAEIIARLEGSKYSLRDLFAGQALRAIVDTDDYAIAEGRRLLAINCYALADAMLAERSKP